MNDIAFHPTHCTLATVGSDGRYSFWDKDARTKLKVCDVIPAYVILAHVISVDIRSYGAADISV